VTPPAVPPYKDFSAYQYVDLKKSFEACEKAVQLSETQNNYRGENPINLVATIYGYAAMLWRLQNTMTWTWD